MAVANSQHLLSPLPGHFDAGLLQRLPLYFAALSLDLTSFPCDAGAIPLFPMPRLYWPHLQRRSSITTRGNRHPRLSRWQPFSDHLGFSRWKPITGWASTWRRQSITANNNQTIKKWVALYTCFVTRAVHLEVINGMTSLTCLQSYRRFAIRWGPPEHVCSDNAA